MNGNLRNNYTFNNHDVRLSYHKYYDMTLSSDHVYLNDNDINENLISYFDFSEQDIYSSGSTSANTIYSLYTWSDAINNGVILNDIGLTGLDNGLVTFDHTTTGITKQNLILENLTGSTYTLPSGDTRFILNTVTGNTDSVIYPLDINDGYLDLKGGFYQGFYQLYGYDYQTLPNRFNKGWVVEIELSKEDYNYPHTGTTLNDLNQNNEGFFYYIGTRSENKFWNKFEGLNTGCTYYCTDNDVVEYLNSSSLINSSTLFTNNPPDYSCYNDNFLNDINSTTEINTSTLLTYINPNISSGCTIYKEVDMVTNEDVPLPPSNIFYDEICNQFLIYDRTSSGYTTCDIEQGECLNITGYTTIDDSTNKFLTYNRTESGLTTCNDFKSNNFTITNKDKIIDIVDNVLGFRIKNDGSVGYRRISSSGGCINDIYSSGYTIEEQYSDIGVVKNDINTRISLRYVPYNTLNECEMNYKDPRLGQMMIYVDGKLKLNVSDFEEIIPRELNEHKSKQQGVAFNISIGGGSQGLKHSITFDGPDPDDMNLPIEEYFTGTFIGKIYNFKLYNDKLTYCNIK